jgi:hypothetical protein
MIEATGRWLSNTIVPPRRPTPRRPTPHRQSRAVPARLLTSSAHSPDRIRQQFFVISKSRSGASCPNTQQSLNIIPPQLGHD